MASKLKASLKCQGSATLVVTSATLLGTSATLAVTSVAKTWQKRRRTERRRCAVSAVSILSVRPHRFDAVKCQGWSSVAWPQAIPLGEQRFPNVSSVLCFSTRNKCIATSNKGLTSSNKKPLVNIPFN